LPAPVPIFLPLDAADVFDPDIELGGRDLVEGAGLGVGMGTFSFRFVAAGVVGVEEMAFAAAIVVLRSPGMSC
jgi:hypothetical protein